MEPGDDDFLRGLYATTRADEMVATGWDPAQVASFLDMQWRAQHTAYARRHPTSDHAVIVADGRAAGRLWVARGPSEIRIVDISLLPAEQGRGIGTQLLEELQAEAKESDRVLTLSVASDNARARALYLRLGFDVVAVEAGYQLMEWVPEGG